MDKMKKSKAYVASGWWSERDKKIINYLEDRVYNDPQIEAYRPRKDGVELTSEQFHDHNLRKKVFLSNVENIDTSDFVVANLDSGSERLDTGTVWETAYATAKGILVNAYQDDNLTDELINRLGFFYYYLTNICTGTKELDKYLYLSVKNNPGRKSPLLRIDHRGETPVFLCDNTGNTKEIVVLLDTLRDIKVVTKPKESVKDLEDILNAPYIIVPTDTKDSNLTFYMGMAYALGTPIFTYSSSGAPLNLMLIFSVVKHIKGLEELSETLSKVSREGVDSFGEYDTSNMKVY